MCHHRFLFQSGINLRALGNISNDLKKNSDTRHRVKIIPITH